MTAVTGFNDRNMINQCLLYRYIISYEPYNFKGSLKDFPLTVEYGKKMDTLRSEYRDYFWDGEFQNCIGARVTLAEGKIHHPYAVYRNRKNNKLGVIISNYDRDTRIELDVMLDNGKKLKKYRLVDDKNWLETERVKIPPESAVILLEE
jgi:hypothetical protein